MVVKPFFFHRNFDIFEYFIPCSSDIPLQLPSRDEVYIYTTRHMYVPLFLIQMTAAVITILHKMYKRETKERLARDDTQQSLEAWRGLTNESLMVFFSQEYNFLEMSTREDREKTVSYTMLLLWVEKLSCFRLFEPNSSSTFVVVR